MKIKSTLLTLAIGSLVCLTALPVQAGSFPNANRGDRDDDRERSQRSGGKWQEKQRQPPKTSKDSNREHRKVRPDGKHKQRPVRPTISHGNKYKKLPPPALFKKKHPVKPVKRYKRPKHRIHHHHHYPQYSYVAGPWYYTRYISPYPYHYHPIGYRHHTLPRFYVRFVIGGFPYFYYSGVYYQSYDDGYVVVSAPIGAFISTLPEGFIAFSIGVITYYYVNNTYYEWNEDRGGYLVVEKPKGADRAIEEATRGRLVIYPNKKQSEEQQAKDRYECHRWAVSDSGFDPTLEEEEYSAKDNDVYRRGLAACLEGRDYTVK